MALKQCKECGASVSKSAKSCPGCGAKQGVGTCGCLAAIVILPFLIIVVATISGGGGSGGSSSSTSSGDALVKNSSWDGSVFHVKQYLKRTLKDPDSYEGIDWSEVQKTDDGNFLVRHKYRAKNSYGGFVIENQIFTYDSEGNILSASSFGN